MRAIFKYPGAKWTLAQWIINMFPEHHSYLEPFLGSGAVLFTKPRSNIETVNDLDDDVVNLFDFIRNDTEKLARAIYLIPYARAEYERAFYEKPKDDFDKAVKFYIRCQMGHGFRTTGEKVGWKNDIQGREKAYAAGYWAKTPEDIIQAAERLRGVQIEKRPAVDLIQRFNFPNVLIYADPPYMLNTRHGKQYKHEFLNEDHDDLLQVLKAHKGYVIISGYETEFYNEQLLDWYKAYKKSVTQTGKSKTEVVWCNFEPNCQLNLL